jgi:hypothetical protein
MILGMWLLAAEANRNRWRMQRAYNEAMIRGDVETARAIGEAMQPLIRCVDPDLHAPDCECDTL